MSILKLNLVARRKPVRAPSSLALSATPQPAANQIPAVHVRTIRVTVVGVETAGAAWEIHRCSSSAFQAQVELGQAWNSRHINSSLDRGFARIAQGGVLIFGEGIAVERKPFAQPRNPIGEVNSGTGVCYIRGSGSVNDRNGETRIALKKSVPSERCRTTSENGGFIHTEFEVWCWLETDFFPMEERLPI